MVFISFYLHFTHKNDFSFTNSNLLPNWKCWKNSTFSFSLFYSVAAKKGIFSHNQVPHVSFSPSKCKAILHIQKYNKGESTRTSVTKNYWAKTKNKHKKHWACAEPKTQVILKYLSDEELLLRTLVPFCS